MRHTMLAVFTLLPTALGAQSSHTVSPGMTRAQVISALGQPATLRTVSEFTYLFYTNACGKRCGMNDLVVLRADSVVDAIFRSPHRHYTGTSSSPTAISPEAAREKSGATAAPMKMTEKPKAAAAKPAAAATKPAPPSTPPTPPSRMTPGKANDTKPSIPLHPPTVQPAAGTKAATPAAPQPATKKP